MLLLLLMLELLLLTHKRLGLRLHVESLSHRCSGGISGTRRCWVERAIERLRNVGIFALNPDVWR
jgi:hypothetical protein